MDIMIDKPKLGQAILSLYSSDDRMILSNIWIVHG